MAGNSKARPGDGPNLILRRGAMAGLGGALVLIVGVHLASQPLEQARKAYWKPSGPPCPATSRAAILVQGLTMDQQFEFQDIRLARVAGEVFCSGEVGRKGLFHTVVTGPTVCQLTNPIAFSVRTGGREYDYAPGIAKPATVTVSQSVPSCVLASNFKYGD